MTGDRSGPTQRAIDFLLKLDPDQVDLVWLPASVDYRALVLLAKRDGVDTDEASLRNAFAMIMRARLIAS